MSCKFACQELDWEVELAVVIGKGGSDISESEALSHIFGYTVAMDASARDWQLKKNGGQWLIGKTMDAFCPLGIQTNKKYFKVTLNFKINFNVY